MNGKSFRERFAAQGIGFQLNVIGSAVGLLLIVVYLTLRFAWPELLPDRAALAALAPLAALALAFLLAGLFLAFWFFPTIEEQRPRLAARLAIKIAFAGLYFASVVDLARRWDMVGGVAGRVLALFMLLLHLTILHVISERLIHLLTYPAGRLAGPVTSGRWLAVVRWGFVTATGWWGGAALVALASEPRPEARLALLAGTFFGAYLLLRIEGLLLEGLFGIPDLFGEELSDTPESDQISKARKETR